MMFFTPGTRLSGCDGAARRTEAPQVSSTSVAPIPTRRARMSSPIWSFSGQAGVVRSTLRATLVPSIWMSLTISRLTMSRWISGSWTWRRTSRMVDSVSMVDILPSG